MKKFKILVNIFSTLGKARACSTITIANNLVINWVNPLL